MKAQLAQVLEFHKAFQIPHRDSPNGKLQPDEFRLRHALLEEENTEYLEACEKGDLIEVADALGDMLYVLCGTMITHGMQHKIEEVFSEIHRSNMSKLDADGKPIYREDGKVLKSDLFFRPSLGKYFDE